MTTTDQGPAVDTAGPAPQEGPDTVSTDQDPGVIRAQERARAKAATHIGSDIGDLVALTSRLDDPRDLDAAGLVQLAASLREITDLAAAAEYAAVALAKDYGATWQAIGDTLGMNRQNAQAKYGKRGTK